MNSRWSVVSDRLQMIGNGSPAWLAMPYFRLRRPRPLSNKAYSTFKGENPMSASSSSQFRPKIRPFALSNPSGLRPWRRP